MINFIVSFYKSHSEKINYVIAGGWNTLFGYGVYFLLYSLFHKQVNYIVLLIPTNIVAITNAYFCYKFFVFKTKGNYLKEYLKFYIVYGSALLLNFLLMPLFVEIFGIPPLVSQGVILFFTIIISYIGHKFFTFGDIQFMKSN